MGKYTAWLKEIRAQEFQEFGGKGANLGELVNTGFNVPVAFCIKGGSYFYFLQSNNLTEAITEIARGIDFNDINDLTEKTMAIQSLITQAQIPKDLEDEICEQYRIMQTLETRPFVAVRSSVAIKETSVSSFPGMMDTFHYVLGEEQVLEHVKRCWASVWSARAATIRHHKGISHSLAIIAPVVQQMIDADVAGIIFTINPMTSSKHEMIIQSSWGIGESVVSGMCANDYFILDKATLSIKRNEIGNKTEAITYDWEKGCGTRQVTVRPEKASAPSLTEPMLRELGAVGTRIETHFGIPQDIEWAYEKGKLFILQTRKAK